MSDPPPRHATTPPLRHSNLRHYLTPAQTRDSQRMFNNPNNPVTAHMPPPPPGCVGQDFGPTGRIREHSKVVGKDAESCAGCGIKAATIGRALGRCQRCMQVRYCSREVRTLPTLILFFVRPYSPSTRTRRLLTPPPLPPRIPPQCQSRDWKAHKGVCAPVSKCQREHRKAGHKEVRVPVPCEPTCSEISAGA